MLACIARSVNPTIVLETSILETVPNLTSKKLNSHGIILKENISKSKEDSIINKLDEAISRGWELLKEGKSSELAVIQTIKILEDSPLFNARYELNNKYLNQLEENGLVASGKNKDTNLVEVVEVKDHPWFIGVQYHPEYKSTVLSPHPLFVSFVSAAILNKNK